ncbi:MAG: dUTPase [Clostridia bacterium]|nr:dUTPase [Clostridia bacterium]
MKSITCEKTIDRVIEKTADISIEKSNDSNIENSNGIVEIKSNDNMFESTNAEFKQNPSTFVFSLKDKIVKSEANAVDKLATIFNMQKSFDEDIIKNRHLEGIEATEWLQKQTLAMVSELAELLDEVNFKWWKNPKEINTDNVRDELVDILHFFISMCIKSGMDSQELYSRYLFKNEENFKRQRGLSEKKGYEVI